MSQTVAPNDFTNVELKRLPSTLSLYRRALLPKLFQTKTVTDIPALSLSITNISLATKQIRKYAKLCGFRLENENLPATFPHIIAFKLHLELMLDKTFPLPLMGLVHTKNVIDAVRPIKWSDKLNFHVFISDARDTPRGIEFDITTEVSIKEEIVWQSISSNLYITKPSKDKHSNKRRPKLYENSIDWQVPENLGRRYALVSADSNPIHLHSLAAKLFGFKQAIAHGMWIKARALANLQPLIDASKPFKIQVEFKKPIYLPNRVALHHHSHDHGVTFQVGSQSGESIHMTGEIIQNITS